MEKKINYSNTVVAGMDGHFRVSRITDREKCVKVWYAANEGGEDLDQILRDDVTPDDLSKYTD